MTNLEELVLEICCTLKERNKLEKEKLLILRDISNKLESLNETPRGDKNND